MMSGRMSLGRFEGDAAAYNPRVARRLLAYLAPHKRMIAAAMVLVSIGSGANVAGPLLLKFGIDEGIDKRNTDTLATIGAIYLLTLFVMWAGSYFQVRISATIGQASLLRLAQRPVRQAEPAVAFVLHPSPAGRRDVPAHQRRRRDQ